jgi:hypothetical protein
MATTIKLKRGTAANWTTTDPTLAAGELGLETDTLKLKAGDGTTAWSSLDYVSADLPLITEIDGGVVGSA